ncbi:MAG: cupin domain-containing protein [Bryobacteraceae bacterium]|nr:cupin domain-containing protein [Bryobacteraceae bacterium]
MSDPKAIPLTDEQLAEQASLAALDFLSPGELALLPRHVVDQYREAAALLAVPVAPVAPPPQLRDRLMRRVADYQELQPASEVRTFDGGWRATGLPGIDFKPLYHDRKTGMFTQLVRMEPGARYPRHQHFDDEQCLVLKGDVRWGEAQYLEGDFVTTRAGIVHPTLETRQGNLLLIISGHNEFLPEPGAAS